LLCAKKALNAGLFMGFSETLGKSLAKRALKWCPKVDLVA